MAYDRTVAGSGPSTLGHGGEPIDYSGGNVTIGNEVKGVVVVATGAVKFRARKGAADITCTGLPAGYILPWHVLTIYQTGTDATLATIEE